MLSALVVDDVAAARTVLADALRAIEPACRIREACCIAEALKLSTEGHDLALVDLRLPDGSGCDLIRWLKRGGDLIVAAVTVMDDDASIEEVLAAGADGYLLKDAEPSLLVHRLERLLAGEPSLTPAIARRVLTRFAAAQVESEVDLSPREREVLGMVARGLRAKEVAQALGISHHTVRDHVKTIYRKLDVTSRAEATLEAHRRRLA